MKYGGIRDMILITDKGAALGQVTFGTTPDWIANDKNIT